MKVSKEPVVEILAKLDPILAIFSYLKATGESIKFQKDFVLEKIIASVGREVLYEASMLLRNFVA